ncbi:acyltransferase family protein [Leptospira perolatii]|uniref:acyltransferase family protein n=1 Tax=Leptospira perolatii TaxID=2023191 RepID=UPI0013FDA0B5|nr:acyltransferase [Leptospira perolatii]
MILYSGTKNQNREVNRYYPSLDFLRAIAVLSVLFFHQSLTFPKVADSAIAPLLRIFKMGWVGVDLFFVLSGFLITERLLDQLSKPNFFLNFYRNRTLRIFPLYYAFLIVVLIASAYGAGPFEAFGNPREYVPYLFYLQNWETYVHGAKKTYFVNHLWSLAVEEHFYLLYPFFVKWINSEKVLLIFSLFGIFAVIVFRMYVVAENGPLPGVYVFSPFRFDSLLFGASLSTLSRIFDTKRLELLANKFRLYLWVPVLIAIFCFGVLGLSSFSPISSEMQKYGFTLIASYFVLVVAAFSFGSPLFSNTSKLFRIFSYVGKISYGIYVFHIPVQMVLLSARRKLEISEGPFLFFLELLISCLGSILLAYLSFRFFESYFLKRKVSNVVSEAEVQELRLAKNQNAVI